MLASARNQLRDVQPGAGPCRPSWGTSERPGLLRMTDGRHPPTAGGCAGSAPVGHSDISETEQAHLAASRMRQDESHQSTRGQHRSAPPPRRTRVNGGVPPTMPPDVRRSFGRYERLPPTRDSSRAPSTARRAGRVGPLPISAGQPLSVVDGSDRRLDEAQRAVVLGDSGHADAQSDGGGSAGRSYEAIVRTVFAVDGRRRTIK